jgi:cytochrome P450
VLGVPLEDHEQFHHWAEEINLGPTALDRSLPASRAMREYLTPIVEDRRARRRDDLISDLVHAEVDGHTLDDEHIYGFLRLLMPAGAETTFRMLGSCYYALLNDPRALAEVRGDRALVGSVIEETLRWESSVTMVNREPVTDVELAGVPVPAGSSIIAMTGSANHDETRYDDAETWNLHRSPQPHLAFGTGHHQCLGMHLARLELRVAINAALDRLPNLRLDPDEPAPVIQGLAFRGPSTIPVLFDPS